jgi:hypothetical protein
MFLRVLYLIAMIGLVGGDSTAPASNDDDNVRTGGEGFGNIVMLVVIIAALVLLAVITLAILSFTGQFENTVVDPRT